MYTSSFFVILSGPTAVGKTAAVAPLAKRLPLEVINADVGQFYEPLSIGTAKPLWRREPVPHHCFDLFKEPVHFSAVSYREKVFALMGEIWARGRIPLFVGGSLFYLRSLFFPPLAAGGEGGQLVKRGEYAHDLPTADLWKQLALVDPERAQALAPTDRYRIVRALALWEKTGTKPSLLRPVFVEPPAPCVFVFLTRDRADLYRRINERVRLMVQEGWLDEVRALSPAWRAFLREKRFIGYPEMDAYLAGKEGGETEREQLIADIQLKTRNYAKRQLTFWRLLRRDLLPQKKVKICEVNLTLCDLALYIEHVFSCVQPFFVTSRG